MRIDHDTFVYFLPFNGKCISCDDRLQGRMVVSWKGIYHCQNCALSANLINKNQLTIALNKTKGLEVMLEELILQRLC